MQISDAGPVLDTMAVLLENMSNITVMARTLIAAVYRTSQIVASIPNLSYQNKASYLSCLIGNDCTILLLHSSHPFLVFVYWKLFSLGIPWGIISSITPGNGPCRPWNQSGCTPHIFCCSCAIVSLSSTLFFKSPHAKDSWYSENALEKCLRIFFFSCALWEIGEEAAFPARR